MKFNAPLLKSLAVLCLLVSWAFPVRADDAPKPLVEITPQLDLTSFKANKTTLAVVPDGGSNALSMKVDAGASFPGFHYTPAGGTIDLSAAKGVQMVITNPGDKMIRVSLKAENTPPPGVKEASSVQGMEIGAGDTRTVQAVFGQNYGNPAYALDPAKISGLTLFVGGDAAPAERTILIHSIDTFNTVVFQEPADPGRPPGDGLVLWLDPSKAAAVTMDANRAISVLKDRSDGHHDAKLLVPTAQPTLNPLDGKHRPTLHFSGKEAFTVDAIRPAPGGSTVFIVYEKVKSKEVAGPSPTLFSSRPDAAKAVDAEPNFVIAGPGNKSAWKKIETIASENLPIGPITIGQDFVGNIGEVLVYDHVFAAEGDRRKVLEYLSGKWGSFFDEPGWVRDGPLDPIPTRTHDDLPLSDQANTGKWTLDHSFTDEFDEKEIDLNRYHIFNLGRDEWVGRQPGMFLGKNVILKDGALNILQDKATPEEVKGRSGYSYTTGYIATKERTGYGYYEIDARPANSEFDDAFWLADTGDAKNGSEIDIFEMGPHTKDYHNRDVMTAHVWGENGDGRHWGSLVTYTTPWELAGDFHVYGLEWTKDNLIWYIDGSPVRKLKNTNWHLPQKLIFDCEPMVSWFGPIDDKDFPTAFVIKYLRIWRQAGYEVPAPATPPAPPAPAAPAPPPAPPKV